MSSPHVPELLTVVFDYSHSERKSMMLRDPNALYRSKGVISTLTVCLPVAIRYWFFSAEFIRGVQGLWGSRTSRVDFCKDVIVMLPGEQSGSKTTT